jgi:hypothetical protein
MLVLFIYITRLASHEIFSPSNKIHQEVGQAKDLSAPGFAIFLVSDMTCNDFMEKLFTQVSLPSLFSIINKIKICTIEKKWCTGK